MAEAANGKGEVADAGAAEEKEEKDQEKEEKDDVEAEEEDKKEEAENTGEAKAAANGAGTDDKAEDD